MLPLLFGGGVTMGLIRAAGGIAGGALSAAGGAANLAATTLGIGAKVAGTGLSAIGGGAKALGSAINPFSGDDSSKLTPNQGETVNTSQPNKVVQQQQKAVKQQQTSTSKLTKTAEDTSRKSEKSGKNSAGILAAMKMQLEKLNDKVGGIIRLVMSGQKQDNRRALEGKIEGARDRGDDASVSSTGIMSRGKKLIQKTGGFLSTVFGLIVKYFIAKIGTLAFFPELAGQFQAFEESVVGFFKNTFDAIKKLFAGDFEGAKESAGAAFEDLGEVLKSVAKFGSGIVDKILSFFGMDELKLFDKAAEKFKDFKERFNSFLTDKSGIEAEDGNFTDRLFGAIKTVLMEIIDKIATFLSPGNLYRLYKEASRRGDIKEEAQEKIGDVLDEKGLFGIKGLFSGSARKRRQILRESLESGALKGSGISVSDADKLSASALEKFDPANREKSLADMSEDERKVFLAVEDQIRSMRQKMIQEILDEEQRKLKELDFSLMPYEDNKAKALALEKKLPPVSGKDLNERGAGTTQPLSIMSDSSSKSNVTNNNIVKGGGSPGSGYGVVGSIEKTQNYLNSTYASK